MPHALAFNDTAVARGRANNIYLESIFSFWATISLQQPSQLLFQLLSFTILTVPLAQMIHSTDFSPLFSSVKSKTTDPTASSPVVPARGEQSALLMISDVVSSVPKYWYQYATKTKRKQERK